ncbi:MAG: DoxX family protein [Candidatus Pelagadaptatus aseana]|uniref:DoxX family protein n=1 Tax=Candidatus Pelagadaptatus aseana TaxID=3120508 RepID=UPI0039B21473
MKTLLKNITHTTAGLDTLPLRLGAGVIFAAHGAQKLFGWFGGYGLEATGGWMASIGIEPGLLMAALAGSAEFFGGLLLIIGLLVRPAAIALAATMVVAIVVVHLPNGLFMTNNGYEFGLALLVISVGLAVRGAGSFSIDRVVHQRLVQEHLAQPDGAQGQVA